MFKRRIVPGRAIFTTLALVGIALIVGCGDLSQRPLAPNPTATVQGGGGKGYSSDGPFTLVFSSRAPDPSKALARATKPTAARSAAGRFSPKKGGDLEVKFDSDSGIGVRVQKAAFEVSKGSIDREVDISMTVSSGSTLADIGCQFTPSGLNFNPPAALTLVLVGNLTEEEIKGLKAYHIESGKVTVISVQIHRSGKSEWTITIKVPGFSTYSLGDL